MNVVRGLVFRLNNTKSIFAFVLLLILTSLFTFTLINTPLAKADTSDTDVTLSINSAIAVSLANCDSSVNTQIINIDIIPTPTGLFKSNCQTVTVNTNAPGYTLTAKATGSKAEHDSGAITNDLLYQNPLDLVSLDIDLPFIPSTTSSSDSPTPLTTNLWGYAVEGRLGFDASYTINNANNNYAELPTTDETIYQTDIFPLPVTEHEFYYGTKLDSSVLAGTYATTITYTAVGADVPEPPTYPKVKNGAYFQETTTNINHTCSALPMYDSSLSGQENAASTVIMIDSRNNQEYRVRRLQDGKCWMIDNLKLATPGIALTLTPTDTNISEGSTFTIPPNAVTTSTDRATNGYCVNGVVSGAGGELTCDGTSSSSGTNNEFIAYVDPSNTTSCLNNTATNGDTSTYSPDGRSGCGYLYNWYTATAGTGMASMATGDATSSICPSGWRLPSVGSGVVATNEFAILNGAMIGANPSITNDATTQPNWYPTGSFSGSYAGFWESGHYDGHGYYGAYWSSSADGSPETKILSFSYDDVYPGSFSYRRYSGESVRCIIDL